MTAEEVLAAPKVSSEGVFGAFRVPAGEQYEWVVSHILRLLCLLHLLGSEDRGGKAGGWGASNSMALALARILHDRLISSPHAPPLLPHAPPRCRACPTGRS